jgi:hypothetical protein
MAAAVRGQNVGFRQCWEFTKPRYGAMLGALFVSGILFSVALFIFYFAAILIGIGGIFALQNAPEPIQWIGGVLGFIAILVFFSIMGVFAFAWLTMVPIVSCLEDDKRGVPAMGRAFELLKGNWRRVFGMCLLLGLAMLAVFGIIGGLYALFAGVASIGRLFETDTAWLGFAIGMVGFSGLFTIFWMPAQTLIIAVLYLDLRVRREALDLEWTAYSSAPPPPMSPVGLVNELPQELGATSRVELSAPSQPQLPETAWEAGPTSLAAGGVAGSVNPPEPSEFSATSFSPPVASPAVAPADSWPPAETAAPVFPPAEPAFESPIELPPVQEFPFSQAPEPAPETSGENEARREP